MTSSSLLVSSILIKCAVLLAFCQTKLNKNDNIRNCKLKPHTTYQLSVLSSPIGPSIYLFFVLFRLTTIMNAVKDEQIFLLIYRFPNKSDSLDVTKLFTKEVANTETKAKKKITLSCWHCLWRQRNLLIRLEYY